MDAFKWARTNLTHLRSFEAAARHLSFSRAAIELGRSQATISVQVRELERELEVSLFDRTTRRVALTEAGETLALGLTEGFKSIGSSVLGARSLAGNRRNRVIVACVPSLSFSRLPLILAGYRERDAVTYVTVEELTYVEMVEAVSEGVVDFGIGPCADPPPPNIAFARAAKDPLCVVLQSQNFHSKSGSASLDFLTSLPLILMKNSFPLQKSLKQVARARSIPLDPKITVRHVHTAIEMVRAGVGAAIVPRLALPDVVGSGLEALPIEEASLTRTIGVLTLRGRRLSSPAAKLARYVNAALTSSGRILEARKSK